MSSIGGGGFDTYISSITLTATGVTVTDTVTLPIGEYDTSDCSSYGSWGGGAYSEFALKSNATYTVYPKFKLSDIGLSSITEIGSVVMSLSTANSFNVSTTQTGVASHTYLGKTYSTNIPKSYVDSSTSYATVGVSSSTWTPYNFDTVKLSFSDEYIISDNAYLSYHVTSVDCRVYLVGGTYGCNVTTAYSGSISVTPTITLTLNSVYGYA